MEKRLYRSRKDKMLAGVCGGVADYFKIDPTIVRVIFAVVAFSSFGTAMVAYFIALLVIPEAPVGNENDETTYGPRSQDHSEHSSFSLSQKGSRQTLGIVLIGAGALILLSKMVNWFDSSMILAVGVVAIGVYMLVQKRDEE